MGGDGMEIIQISVGQIQYNKHLFGLGQIEIKQPQIQQQYPSTQPIRLSDQLKYIPIPQSTIIDIVFVLVESVYGALDYQQIKSDTMQTNHIQLDQTQTNPQLIQYQHCPYCNRNFFKGKLQLHLKLCTPQHPMHVSPKRTPKRTHSKLEGQSKQSVFSSQEKKCPNCDTRLHSFLMDRHLKKCNQTRQFQEEVKPNQRINNSTQINFKQKQEVNLPIIKKIVKQPTFQIKKQVYMVKLRDELRCFRKAEAINEVECTSCGRHFSKPASLRHVPICQQLKLKQKYTTLLKRGKKTMKSSLVQQFRSKSCEKRKKNRSCLQVKEQSQFKLFEQ